MADQQQSIDQLLGKLEALLKKQEGFSKEMEQLRLELEQLQHSKAEAPRAREAIKEPKAPEEQAKPEAAPVPSGQRFRRDRKNGIIGGVCAGLASYLGMSVILMRILWIFLSLFLCVGILIYILFWIIIPNVDVPVRIEPKTPETRPLEPIAPVKHEMPRAVGAPKKAPYDLEKYIGENLISKIGIAILIIGVGIGAKYSIDNALINPTVRIILGYAMGLSLLVIGIRLKPKYENFSAVLVSGAMAIMYFITFAAFTFFAMMPLTLAFVLMLLFTVATVGAALNYDQQIIAHIGLVGAYALPFLLSEGKGDPAILFGYVAIINCGILYIAYKKYWKPLYLTAFFVTWLVVLSWYGSGYETELHFGLFSIFLLLFFVLFYLTFLAYKIFKKEAFESLDILLLLANSFVFYGLGYDALQHHAVGAAYLGLFTLLNSVLHFVVSVLVYRQKLADKNLFYLVSGLVLVFFTIAIPIQLNGSWVTLLWGAEAALLFWIGRTKKVAIYEKIGYPMMVLSFMSLVQDWGQMYQWAGGFDRGSRMVPIFNHAFLTSILVIAILAFINYLHYNKKNPVLWAVDKEVAKNVSLFVSAMLLIVLYFAFAMEIAHYWDGLYADYEIIQATDDEFLSGNTPNYDLRSFKTLWLMNYTLFFAAVLALVNIVKFKSRVLGILNMVLNVLGVAFFLTIGLYLLSELRDSYLIQERAGHLDIGRAQLGMRYISFAFLALVLIAQHGYMKQEFVGKMPKIPYELSLAITFCWIASSELIHWLALSGYSESYKLGLTILWGLYALLLIVLGIWKKKKHLRIAAIVLFSATLLKLFFYDIAHLSTLSKTVVLIALGVLLLIISFLYNRFRQSISDENGEQP
ncbi:MAG: DUF2339 domain-containing protein [Flavobacteriales bacterium]|nr:MAG: DUF2339 domain-containing protein [Flavobacteriales bacterium]